MHTSAVYESRFFDPSFLLKQRNHLIITYYVLPVPYITCATILPVPYYLDLSFFLKPYYLFL
jgi:hypothetical protein